MTGDWYGKGQWSYCIRSRNADAECLRATGWSLISRDVDLWSLSGWRFLWQYHSARATHLLGRTLKSITSTYRNPQAKLRLPETLTDDERMQRVDSVVRQVGRRLLNGRKTTPHCADESHRLPEHNDRNTRKSEGNIDWREEETRLCLWGIQ